MKVETVMIGVDTLTQLSQLVANHGIYALFVIFLFYLERRAAKLLKGATNDKEKIFFQRKYSQVLVSVFVCGVLVAGVWIYATFYYRDKITIEGVLEGLRHEVSQPASIGEQRIVDRIAAIGNGFFMREKPAELDDRSIDVEWVLVTSNDESESLDLKLQHNCSYLPSGKEAAVVIGLPGEAPVLKPQMAAPLLDRIHLDLRALKDLARKRVELVYKSDESDPCRHMGTLAINDGKRFVPLPWMSANAAPKPIAKERKSALFGLTEIWADPIARSGVPALTPDVTARLTESLASQDLEKQLSAQAILEANGAASYSFIERQLDWASATIAVGRDYPYLVQSLVAAVEKIELSGPKPPPGLQLGLAKALYAIGEYKRSSERFDNVPDSAIGPDLLLLRGAADTRAGNYLRARKSFEAYARQAVRPHDKSLALGNLGALMLIQGRNEDSRQALSDALKVDPSNGAALLDLGLAQARLGRFDESANTFSHVLASNPGRTDVKVNLSRAYQKLGKLDPAMHLLEEVVTAAPRDMIAKNNLAYIYTLKGVYADRALAYSEEALRSDPERPAFLDTRGWILLQQGRVAEGVPLLEKAATKAPNDTEIREHLMKARQALAKR